MEEKTKFRTERGFVPWTNDFVQDIMEFREFIVETSDRNNEETAVWPLETTKNAIRAQNALRVFVKANPELWPWKVFRRKSDLLVCPRYLREEK